MKKFDPDAPALPDYRELTLEGYIRKYYIDGSKGHGMKYPKVILETLGFMGSLHPIEFWRWLLEPQRAEETRNAAGDRLVWKYADRLAQCAAEFVRLPENDQDYVMKARRQERPIWWRGDGMGNFRAICRETWRYNQLDDTGKAAYRRSVLAQVARVKAGG